jgi:hypothetical protein
MIFIPIYTRRQEREYRKFKEIFFQSCYDFVLKWFFCSYWRRMCFCYEMKWYRWVLVCSVCNPEYYSDACMVGGFYRDSVFHYILEASWDQPPSHPLYVMPHSVSSWNDSCSHGPTRAAIDAFIKEKKTQFVDCDEL